MRLACSPERWEETRRQAGWAKTFGLPLELISAEEAREKFPLMVTDGVLGASWLPTDGYLDPSLLTYALADGARARRLPRSTEHARDRDRRPRRPRAPACAPTAATSRPRWSSSPAACTRPRSGGWPACASRSSRWPTSTSSRSRSGSARGAHLPTMRDPDLLIYFREEGGGLVMGGYERDSAPWSLRDGGRGLDEIPPDFNGRLLEEDWDRFEEIVVNSRMRVPAMEDVQGHEAHQRPRGVHARQRVLPRRDRGARPVRRRRLLRARPRRRGRRRQGDGRVDRRRRAVARPLAHGHPPLRRALPLAALHARARPARSTRPTTTSSTPTTSGRPGGRCGCRPPTRGTREHGAVVRREVGLGARQLVRGQRGGGRRGAAPARLGGHALVARDRRRAPRLPRGGGAVRRVLVRQARGHRARARPSSSSACATTASPARSARSPTRRCSTAAAASSATSRSRGWTRTASGSSPARRSATTTSPGSARTCRPRARPTCGVADVTSQWACFGLWGPRAREILARLHDRRPRRRGVPVHDVAGHRPSATCRCARCG